MKDVNLKDQDVCKTEDTNQAPALSSDNDGCACSPEFGCKNCEADTEQK